MSTREEILRQDASRLASTLLRSWGYAMPLALLDKVDSLNFSFDVDKTVARHHRLRCTSLYVQTTDKRWYHLYPLPPGVRLEVAFTSTPPSVPPPDKTELTVEFEGHPFVSSPDTYQIPDFSTLLRSDTQYAELSIEEVRYENGERGLYLPEDHPLYASKGALHVYLLERWIHLLSMPPLSS